MCMKQSEADDRMTRARRAIELIMETRGTVYTVGLLMGIVCRLSRTDYQLVKDLETRSHSHSKDLT
jgi:hypothetical protein